MAVKPAPVNTAIWRRTDTLEKRSGANAQTVVTSARARSRTRQPWSAWKQ